MPSDTYDPFLGLILQGAGNNNNTWGDKLNDSVIKPTARGIAGLVTRALSGGTLDLSGSPPPATTRQDIDYIQVISGGGAFSSMQTIIVPSLAKTWLFYNAPSSGTIFPLMVKITGASLAQSAQIPSGTWKLLWCDGSQVRRLDYIDIGTMVLTLGSINTFGMVVCNGQSLLRTSYQNLFDVIGTNYGSLDGTHFNVPNMGTFSGVAAAAYWMKY